MLTEAIFAKIQQGNGLLSALRREVHERYRVVLKTPKLLGLGTTVSIQIPIWCHRMYTPADVTFELIEFFNFIDYVQYESARPLADFLGQFAALVQQDNIFDDFRHKLEQLWFAVESSIQTLVDTPEIQARRPWFDEVCRHAQELIENIKRPVPGMDSPQALVHRLCNDPARHMLQEVYERITSSRRGVLRISPAEAFPPYRLRFPSTFFSVREALVWGVETLLRPSPSIPPDCRLVINLQMASGEPEKAQILLSGPGIRTQEAQLRPLQTRLATLGVANEFRSGEDVFVIHLPIWRWPEERKMR